MDSRERPKKEKRKRLEQRNERDSGGGKFYFEKRGPEGFPEFICLKIKRHRLTMPFLRARPVRVNLDELVRPLAQSASGASAPLRLR